MQSNQSVRVVSGRYKGRAGRVISAYPYRPEGAKPGAPLAVDVILDADAEHPHANVTFPIDALELLG